MSASTAKETVEKLKESEKKWGKEAIAAGFTVFPNTLLIKQHALGLDCYHLVIILQIHKHWWYADNAPFPSHSSLAEAMKTNRSTVKRKLNELRSWGFISWTERKNKKGGQASNVYDLSGLIAHVKKYAEEELVERAKHKEERKALHARKKPRLHVVRNEGDVDE